MPPPAPVRPRRSPSGQELRLRLPELLLGERPLLLYRPPPRGSILTASGSICGM
ncbi:hypothetical protein BN2537_1117 [Streptomyces venezuelae]|nr:hypothetical protein BN2537_1117 [Streptomyces venezuelae]